MAKRGRPRQPLDERHRYAIMMLVWGMRTKEALAEELGISRMALWKWEQRDDFREAYEKEYREMVRALRRAKKASRKRA